MTIMHIKITLLKLITTLSCLLMLSINTASAAPTLNEDLGNTANRRIIGTQQENMLGNWPKNPIFERLGIEPSIVWISDIQGNPKGGISRGLREFDNLFINITTDLEKMFNIKNTTFFTSFSQRSGSSLTKENIGNLFNVTQVCCGATFRVVDVYLEKSVVNDSFNLRLGRIATGDEFLSSPIYWLFVQNGIDGNPVGIFRNAPGMSAYPKGTWGVRGRIKTQNNVYFMAGLYNGDPNLGANNKHGLDWSMRGPLFAIAEAGYKRNQDSKLTKGLPGNYKIGFYHNNGVFDEFLYDINGNFAPLTALDYRTKRGNYGFYFLIDQMIYSPEPNTHERGLTPFVSVLLSPDKAISNMPFFINGGLVYHGLFASRAKDIAGLAFIYGSLSSDLQQAQTIQSQIENINLVQTHELVFEGMYLFQVTPWLKIQPDVQYIIRPGATGNIPNALVVGAQVGVTI